MQIHLKKGEKIYVNGAIIKAEHRCSIELLNNVNFLLESHVMQQERADTPIKQIYFTVQRMLISPEDASTARESYWQLSDSLHSTQVPLLIKALLISDSCVKNHKYFDALKILRHLFNVDDTSLRTKPNKQKETGV
jgi:flagellar biosynthesis repressor protein FlbT